MGTIIATFVFYPVGKFFSWKIVIQKYKICCWRSQFLSDLGTKLTLWESKFGNLQLFVRKLLHLAS